MPEDGNAVSSVTTAQSGDTPTAQSVSDGTSAVSPVTATNVTDSSSASTPASTRSDDTRGQGYDFDKLTTHLTALPESVANAVKEVLSSHTSAAPAPAQTPANSDTTGSGSTVTDASGDNGASAALPFGERARGWWFGK